MSAELLWEALRSLRKDGGSEPGASPAPAYTREPMQKLCAATTKSGKRCKGKARPGQDFCTFHDPSLTAEQRREIASRGGKSHRRLNHLPDGYLRKLQTPAAVGEAMDRLYREVRLGQIEPAMARTLLDILTRLHDRLASKPPVKTPSVVRPTRAQRVRPKLEDELSRAERDAWQKMGIEPQGGPAAAPANHLHHPLTAPATEPRRVPVTPLVQIVRANAS
jgi:hypothetical protein